MLCDTEFDDVYNAGMTVMRGNNKAERSMSAPPASHIQEINAVLPSSSIPFVLGNGSDSSEENNFHRVSSAPIAVKIAPVTVEHLKWDANVFGGNEFPMRMNCLLDNGAHLVLIRPETVADLALPIRKLNEPICVTLALQGKKTITELFDYVHLQLSSVNNEWSSKTVCALIAPRLCSNILLGLPFLAHNNIVIDHTARTAIDKELGFDLMNDNDRMPRKSTKKMVPPKIRVKQILENHKAMINELKTEITERRQRLDKDNACNAKPVNAITIIKNMIERLISSTNWRKL